MNKKINTIIIFIIFITLFLITFLTPLSRLKTEKTIKVTEQSYLVEIPEGSDTINLTMGNSADNDISLDLPKIAKKHLSININRNKQISFNNSSNSRRVAVNDHYLSNYKLAHNDEIILNGTKFKYQDFKFCKRISFDNDETVLLLFNFFPFNIYPPLEYNHPQKIIFNISNRLGQLSDRKIKLVQFLVLFVLTIALFRIYKQYFSYLSSYIINITSKVGEFIHTEFWPKRKKFAIFIISTIIILLLSMFFNNAIINSIRTICFGLVFISFVIFIYLLSRFVYSDIQKENNIFANWFLKINNNYLLNANILLKLINSLRDNIFCFTNFLVKKMKLQQGKAINNIFVILLTPLGILSYLIGLSSLLIINLLIISCYFITIPLNMIKFHEKKYINNIFVVFNWLIVSLGYIVVTYIIFESLFSIELLEHYIFGNLIDILIFLTFIHLLLLYLASGRYIIELVKTFINITGLTKLLLTNTFSSLLNLGLNILALLYNLSLIAIPIILLIGVFNNDIYVSIVNYNLKARHNLLAKGVTDERFQSVYSLQDEKIYPDGSIFSIGYSKFKVTTKDNMVTIANIQNKNRKLYSELSYAPEQINTSSYSKIKIIYDEPVNIKKIICKKLFLFGFIGLILLFLSLYLYRQLSVFILIFYLIYIQGTILLSLMSFYSYKLANVHQQYQLSIFWGFIFSIIITIIIGQLHKRYYHNNHNIKDIFKQGLFGFLNSIFNTEDDRPSHNIIPYIFFYAIGMFLVQKLRGNELGIMIDGGYFPIFEFIKLIFVIMATYLYSKNSSMSRYWGWILCFVLAFSFAIFLDDQSYLVIFGITFAFLYLSDHSSNFSTIAIMLSFFIFYLLYFNFVNGYYIHHRFFMCRYPWSISNEQFYLSSHFINSNIDSITMLDNVPQIKDDFSLSLFFFVYKSWGIIWVVTIIFWLLINSIRKSIHSTGELSLIKRTYNNIIVATSALIIAHYLITIGNIAGTSPIVGIPACMLSFAKLSNILFVIPSFTILVISSYYLQNNINDFPH